MTLSFEGYPFALIAMSCLKPINYHGSYRYFLERVCSEIVELDRASLYRYPGNYAKYLELKASRLAAEDAETGHSLSMIWPDNGLDC